MSMYLEMVLLALWLLNQTLGFGLPAVSSLAGGLRIYDGAAVSPRGRVIGLEVKSGGAARTGAPSAFDAGVSTFNPAIGVGENAGLEVGRSLLILRP